MGMETDEIGIPYYTQSFVIGFDDLVEHIPGNPPVVKQNGKNWKVNCRIKASDTGFVNPRADGPYDEHEYQIETHVPISIEIYEDPNFQTPLDHPINISQQVYVQVKANVEENINAMIHIKLLGIYYIIIILYN